MARVWTHVDKRPMCDFCHKKEATFDGKTVFGAWAYMCDECFKALGTGLGTGVGQELLLKSEKPESKSKLEAPTVEQLQEWMEDGLCENEDGDLVELDAPDSPFRKMGLI